MASLAVRPSSSSTASASALSFASTRALIVSVFAMIRSPRITQYPIRGTTANRSRSVEVFLKPCPQGGRVPLLNHLRDPLAELCIMRMDLESRQGGECGGLGAAGDQLDQEFGRRGKAEHDHGKENSLPQYDRWLTIPERSEHAESFGQARPPQSEDGCLANRDIVQVEVSRDQRQVLLRAAGKQAAEAFGEDLGLAVAQARLEPQDQAGRLGSVVAQRLGARKGP